MRHQPTTGTHTGGHLEIPAHQTADFGEKPTQRIEHEKAPTRRVGFEPTSLRL